MPWRAGSDLPLRVTSTTLIVTMPELLNLSVDARLATTQPVQRVLQGFLASAEIGDRAGSGEHREGGEHQGLPTQASGGTSARRVRKHSTAHPARTHAGLALPARTHPSIDPAPALRLRFGPTCAATSRSQMGAPLALVLVVLSMQSVSIHPRTPRRSPPPAGAPSAGPTPAPSPAPARAGITWTAAVATA